MEQVRQILKPVKESIVKNFRYATVNFLFVIVYVNGFQMIFGAENSIVGVIFAIMMSASMVRDLTARPVKHLLTQTAVLFLMTFAACFVSNAPPPVALPVNFLMIFMILYAYTFEYSSHLYFPYILSYLFLVFISPAAPEQLSKRLLGVFVGAVSIILYQLINGRKRVAETARDVLGFMLGQADECVRCMLTGKGVPQRPEQLRENLCKLSQIVYDRRKRNLCISDAGFAVISAGQELENLVLMLYELEGPVTQERAVMLEALSSCLEKLRAFAADEKKELPPLFSDEWTRSDEAGPFYSSLNEVCRQMARMTQPDNRRQYSKTLLSLSVRLKAALRVSPVRVVYALRVSCLIALCTMLVQLMALPHGKWLIFTLASVSLPYADDVGTKAQKRMLATLIGGLCSVVAYALIPGPLGRTAVMMLSGYLSFYFSDYSATFACSTVGALGGAVFVSSFGWAPVGSVLLIRLGYVALGILIAVIANRLLFPFSRNKATHQLAKKYRSTTQLLAKVCEMPDADSQLYYGLVIQAYLQEGKLLENARELNWEGAKDWLKECRSAVLAAYRVRRFG